MYELAILGGGPAGVSAGVYAARKLLQTVFITEEFGGQSVVSADVQNWIGTTSIRGADLAKSFREHLHAYAGDCVDIVEGARAEKIEKTGDHFTIRTSDGKTYETKTVLIATGANRRTLNVPGAKEFDNKGLTYCASCDGPLFSGMDVAVVGGGNAGFETAAQLLAYAKSVTLLQRGKQYKADPITVEKVLGDPKMTGLTNAEITEVKGDAMVSGLTYLDKNTGETKELAVKGVFVEIGLVPNTDLVNGLVECDEYKRIVADPRSQKTSVSGIWAAGDCTNELYHQNNIAAGSGVVALEDIYMHLRAR